MPALPALSAAQRRIWRAYLLIGVVFAVVNGLYTSYAFLYIKHRLVSADSLSGSLIDNLLFIIIASMVFEFFAEPITGDLADAHGRRRVVVGTFLGLSLALAAYWLMSADAVSGLAPGLQQRVIVTLSLVAELCFAISAALFTGALDAWFVDELRLVHGPEGGALLRWFSLQRRWCGVFMVAGGVLSLWFARAAFHGSAPAPSGLLTTTALPWLAALGLTMITALLVGVLLVERRVAVASHEPAHRRIAQRLRRILHARELRNALLISSVLYTCWICFMYLLPVLLTEPRILSEAGLFRPLVQDYYWYYLAMGTSRFLGPYLSSRFQLGGDQILQFRCWGLINCGALAVAGIALLARSDSAGGAPSGAAAALVPLALVLFWVAKVAEEAFKPVRSTYLNYLVVDSADRAFVLSMATPAGAVLIVLGIGLLALAQHVAPALDEVRLSVPLLFLILGALGVALTVRLSRRLAVSRSPRPA